MNHVIADPATGTIYGGGGSEWFGPAVWKSTDLGATWTHSSAGMAYPEGEEPIKSVWSLAKNGTSLYAGVEPAGLFRSDDDGAFWNHVSGLRNHPSRAHWHPGGGGLILHSLVLHPSDDKRIWAGISAAGVFHTADGGETWETRNRGTRAEFLPEGENYPEFGQCVHCSHDARHARAAFISKIIAACTAATMAASDGRASRRVCHRASAFRPLPTRATRQRFTCCRSTAT